MTYADDVLQEDWLRGRTWDIRLSDGRPARTLDEVARALGTTDIQQVAVNLLRLPFGKSAPDDLKVEAVTYLAQLSTIDAQAKSGSLAVEVKSGGINIGGWWGLRGFTEAQVVRDQEGRFVDRLGFGGVDAGSLGGLGGIGGDKPPAVNDRVHVPISDGNGGQVDVPHRVASVAPNGDVTTGEGQTLPSASVRAGAGRRATTRANARQRSQQTEAIDAIVRDLAEPLQGPAQKYADAIVNGSDTTGPAQDLLAIIEEHPQWGVDIAALINPADIGDAPDAPNAPDVPPAVTEALKGIKSAGRPIPPAAGTKEDPIDVGGDLHAAILHLSEGKHVRLNQPDEVSSMLDILAVMVDDAKAKGDKAPNINLCNVTVPDTNLFCTESKGIPRLKMPQLSGTPDAGSPGAALMKPGKTEVDLTPQFAAALEAAGISATPKTVKASHLRASQAELDGPKVAGMTRAMEAGKVPEGAIYVTRDGYIIDGHHRWASKVAIDVRDGKVGDVDMPVIELDMEIGEALDYANAFAASMGIHPKGLGAASEGKAPDAPKVGDMGQPLPDAPDARAAKQAAKQADLEKRFPVGTVASTNVASIGGKSEDVTGTVVGVKRGSVLLKTESHGTLAVEPEKIVTSATATPDVSKPAPPKTPTANGPMGPGGDGSSSTGSNLDEAQMIAEQEDLLGRMVSVETGFDPLAPGVDLSTPENYTKGRDAMFAAGKAKDYDREAQIKVALVKVSGAGGIDWSKPVPGLRPGPISDGVAEQGVPWGSGYAEGDPRTDPHYDKYVHDLEERLTEAEARLGSTADTFDKLTMTDDDPYTLYTTERRAAHKAIVDALMEGYKDVPKQRVAVVLAGPPGSGKTTVIDKDGATFGITDPSKFAVLNPDDMKTEIIKAGLLPSEYKTDAGLGELESAGLIHKESSHINKLLRARLYDGGYNVILDGTFGDRNPAEEAEKVTQLKSLGYIVTGTLVDGTTEQSRINAAVRHQVPPAVQGGPFEGRYVPEMISNAQVIEPLPDGSQPLSKLHGRPLRSQSSYNFDAIVGDFNGGVVIYNNDQYQAEVVHSTIPGAGSEEQMVAEGVHLQALLSYTTDPAEQAAIREQIRAQDTIFTYHYGSLATAFVERGGVMEQKAAGGADRNRGNAEQLRRYWTHGAGAAKIRWGESGDFDRCVTELTPHLGVRAKGYCNLRHQDAVGAPPGKGHGPKGKADAGSQTKENVNSEFADGIMVALYPDDATAATLTVPGGLPVTDLHVTLAYLGKIEEYEPVDLDDLFNLVQGLAADIKPLTGTVNGVGKFIATDPEQGDPVYANVDVPGLENVRGLITAAIDGDGFEVSATHGFTPHMTLRYDKGDAALPKVAVHDVMFDFLSLSIGADVYDFPLGVPQSSGVAAEQADAAKAEQADAAKAPSPEVVEGDGDTLADRALRGEQV
ncbi:MAG: zeta toxin family protein [Rhodoglobus sp.]